MVVGRKRVKYCWTVPQESPSDF